MKKIVRLSDVEREPISLDSGRNRRCPSQHPFPCFALCPPVYAGTSNKNNPTMSEFDEPIDLDKFLAQWYGLYGTLAANSLVYLIPPVKGLEDQTYVNSFAYLPHIQDKDVAVLSNFTAEGRPGEEHAVGKLLKSLGYETYQIPFKFEGEPELKYVRQDIYLGGWGFRTDKKAFDWLKEKFGCKIIPIKEQDETLYHLDCQAFTLNPYKVMLCTELMERETVKEIERYVDIVPVTKAEAYCGACNSLKVETVLYNASPLKYMKHSDEGYDDEKKKNEKLERVCRELGYDLMFFDLSECEKAGAKLSCFVGHLNYRD